MDRKEAIRRIKAWDLDSDDMDVLAELIPELKEDSDEMLRERLINKIHSSAQFENSFKRQGFDIEELLKWLEKQGKQENFIESFEIKKNEWYVCIKDYYAGGKKQCSKGYIVQAKPGVYMMGLDKKEAAEYFFPINVEHAPIIWNDTDENIKMDLINAFSVNSAAKVDEFMGMRAKSKYKIIDWLTYLTTKGISSHWRPTEAQLDALCTLIRIYAESYDGYTEDLQSLYNDIKKLR